MNLAHNQTKSSFYESLKQSFAFGLGASAGYTVLMIAKAVFCLLFFGIGYFLLRHYNKKETNGDETPLFTNMDSMQYLGCVLMVIGLLPYAGYFFMGFLFSGGADVANNMFN